MTFPVLETKRLLLRQITLADAENLFSFFSDPQVMRFYDCEAFASIEQAIGIIQRFAEWFERQNGFRWGIALKAEYFNQLCAWPKGEDPPPAVHRSRGRESALRMPRRILTSSGSRPKNEVRAVLAYSG